MQTKMTNVFLAASLAALALPATAQKTAAASKSPAHKPTTQQHKKDQKKRVAHSVPSRKLTAGEAASLERQEAGLSAEERDGREDNRGRHTSAKHTAQLKTGQLTTRQAAKLKTNKAALSQQSRSKRNQSRKLAPKDRVPANQPPDQSTNEIHLKQHNARMF